MERSIKCLTKVEKQRCPKQQEMEDECRPYLLSRKGSYDPPVLFVTRTFCLWHCCFCRSCQYRSASPSEWRGRVPRSAESMLVETIKVMLWQELVNDSAICMFWRYRGITATVHRDSSNRALLYSRSNRGFGWWCKLEDAAAGTNATRIGYGLASVLTTTLYRGTLLRMFYLVSVRP